MGSRAQQPGHTQIISQTRKGEKMESWNELEQIKKKLEQNKRQAEEILVDAPSGKLRIDRGGG
jgi:hypothetical protein